MDIELLPGVTAAAILLGVGQVAKMLGLPSRLTPLVVLIVALIGAFGYTAYSNTDIYKAVVLGLAWALPAVGAWSGTKNVVQVIKGDRPN